MFRPHSTLWGTRSLPTVTSKPGSFSFHLKAKLYIKWDPNPVSFPLDFKT